MNRYILSSPNFTGEIKVTYSIENQLVIIDFQAAELTVQQVEYFTRKCPAVWSDKWLDAFGTKTLKAVHEQYEVTFDQFWDKYGLKRNRERCLKVWEKLSKAEQVKAYAGLWSYFRHLTLNQWKSKADPDTYLRNKYWQNDYKN